MQTIADQWIELADNNHFFAETELAGLDSDAATTRRAAAWEAVAQRHTAAGLRFRW